MEFETCLGWACIIGQEERLYRVCFGFETASALRARLRSNVPWDIEFVRWNPPLAERIQSFLQGTPDSFHDVLLGEVARTPFAAAVIEACRAIPPGSTLSYNELAARVGRPGAARAVGNVLAKNPVPIVVPCHRVVGSGGALGGYSASGGVALKRWLLALEGAMSARRGGEFTP